MTHEQAVKYLDAIENILTKERLSGRDRYSPDFAIVLEALYLLLYDEAKRTDKK